MKRLTSLLFGFALALTGVALADTPPFPDVPEGHWATEAVKRLAETGLIEGKPNGKFEGNVVVTRYEFAVVIARLLELTTPVTEAVGKNLNNANERAEFPDVLQNHWALSAANRVGRSGIMEGDYMGRFKGNSPLKRYELSVALLRLPFCGMRPGPESGIEEPPRSTH